MSRRIVIGLVVVASVIAIGGLLFRFALPGLSSARPQPPAIETAVATWLLLHSVLAEDATRVNPVQPNEAGLAAGASLFQQNCAVSMASTAAAA
jgi:mono/diheme cytochrome c family protein